MHYIHNLLTNELVTGYSFLTLICLISAICVILYLRKSIKSLPSFLSWFLNGMLVLMLLIPMLMKMSITNTWSIYFTDTRVFLRTIRLLPYLTILVLLWFTISYLLVKFKPSHKVFILLILIPCWVISRGVYLYLFKVELFSDFATMWHLVETSTEWGRILLPSDTSIITSPVTVLYLRRILPIWEPLALIFGASPWVFKIANVILTLLTCLMTYRFTNKFFGKTAAQLGSWFILFIPEVFFSIGIPTHDLNGIFLLMLFLTLYDCMGDKYKIKKYVLTLVYGIMAGIIWLLTDLQRDYGIFMLLGTLIYTGAKSLQVFSLNKNNHSHLRTFREISLIVLVLFLLPFLSMKITSFTMIKAGIYEPRDQTARRTYLFTSLDNPEGVYVGSVAMMRVYDQVESSAGNRMDEKSWKNFYRNSVLSEYLYNQLRYVPQLINRANKLLAVGNSEYFYILRYDPDSRIIFPKEDNPLRLYNLLFMFIYLTLGIMTLFHFLGKLHKGIDPYLPLIILGSIIFPVFILGEVQPRYSYPIWFLLTIYIGSFLDHLFRKKRPCIYNFRYIKSEFCLAIFMVTFGYLLSMGCYSITSNKMLYMHGWQTQTNYYKENLSPSFAHIYDANNIRLKMRLLRKPLKGDWVRKRKIFSVGDQNAQYMMRGIISFPNVSDLSFVTKGTFELVIRINGKDAYRKDYTDLYPRTFIEISDITPKSGKHFDVEIEIIALAAYDHSDWNNASEVNISHVHLIQEYK